MGRRHVLSAATDVQEAQLPPATEAQDKQGCTPLHAAAAGGHWAALELLLKGTSLLLEILIVFSHVKARCSVCLARCE